MTSPPRISHLGAPRCSPSLACAHSRCRIFRSERALKSGIAEVVRQVAAKLRNTLRSAEILYQPRYSTPGAPPHSPGLQRQLSLAAASQRRPWVPPSCATRPNSATDASRAAARSPTLEIDLAMSAPARRRDRYAEAVAWTYRQFKYHPERMFPLTQTARGHFALNV